MSSTQPLAGVLLNKQRWLHSFESRDGADEILFPRGEHEWESSQGLRLADASIIGTSYAINLMGTSIAPKDLSNERLRYVVFGNPTDVDTELDTQRAQMYEYGMGKLWSRDSLDVKRWAWARLAEMPSISIGVKDNNIVPVSLSFIRYSDWYDENETIVTHTVVTPSYNFNITNDGSAMITNIEMEIRSKIVAGFTNPRVTNLTTGEWFQIMRTAQSANSILRVTMQEYRVEYSNDAGVTYVSDYSKLNMGGTQVGLLRLVRGANVVQFEDAGASHNADVSFSYYRTYH